MSSTKEQVQKACEEIITQKLLNAARSKEKVLSIAYQMTDWACRSGVDRNDELWDLIDLLREEGKKDGL